MRTATQLNIVCVLVLVTFIAMFLIMSWTAKDGRNLAMDKMTRWAAKDERNPSLARFSGITARKTPETVTTFETIPQQNSDERDHQLQTLPAVASPLYTLSELDQAAAARNLEAKQRLKQFCKNFKPTEDRMWHMKLNRDLNLAYCFIPKSASTTLRGYFHGGLAQANDNLDLYTKFIFVREPLTRLLSCYKDKFLSKGRRAQRWMNIELDILPKGTNSKSVRSGEVLVSFKQFIEYLFNDVNVEMGKLNRHWRPYYEICKPCSYDWDFIGHYEFLSDDINYVRKLAKADDRLKPFPASNSSKTSRELIFYYSQLPPKWITRLGEIFQADFEMFGYPFPGPLKELVKDVL